MRRDLERRLQAVQAARIGASTVELWIEMADGMMRGPRREMIPGDEFELRRVDLEVSGPGGKPLSTVPVVILPDNDHSVTPKD